MESYKINFNCSPKTFKQEQTDESYRQEMISKVVMQAKRDFNEIIFSEINSVESQQTLSDIENTYRSSDTQLTLNDEIDFGGSGGSGVDGKKNEWLYAATKLLICLVKELRPLVGKSANLKNKKKMWFVIAEKLCEKGYFYTGQQVEAKYYGLERQYKKNKMPNSQTGRNRQICPYQTELEDLMRERKLMNPEYVLDEETDVSAADVETEESVSFDADTSINATTSTSVEATITKSRKRTVQEQLLQRLNAILEERKKFEEKTLHFLKLKEQRDKRKEERAERDDERKKRKLELLETLVAKITEQ